MNALAQAGNLRWVVPYPPGGGTDVLARTLAEAMRGPLGMSIVVENKPGASTNIAAQDVARAAPDGRTVLQADNALMAFTEHLFKKLPVYPDKDFSYIGGIGKFPLALVVHLGREGGAESTAALLRDAVHEYFDRRAESKRRELRQLFHTGRISLAIGLAFLAGAIALAQFLGKLISHEGYAWLVSESLIIGGWVALWRPLEIFLYDWWPIRSDARLFDRLAAMPVTLRGADVPAGQAA